MEPESPTVGLVVGTQEATPLDLSVAVAPGHFLQLDDVVALERSLPDGETVKMYGVVSQISARNEGAQFDSDVFLIDEQLLPAEASEVAAVSATRFEPEVFVPPLPGSRVRLAQGAERDQALFFDRMRQKVPVGLSHDEQPMFANLEFIDGTRGAHVNISGISGVATKTTYATFLLYSLFNSGVLGAEALNTKALIVNVKGEGVLSLDQANARLTETDRERSRRMGLEPKPFDSVRVY